MQSIITQKEFSMDIQFVNNLIDEKKDELFQLLSKLIQFNSENFATYGNEAACAEYIAKLCKELGMEADSYSPMELPDFENHPDYLPGRSLENRYNVSARWKGAEDTDALMLMGHIDTMPIGALENWTVDPLGGEIRDGKIWGRGACDDKYALATALFLIKLLKEQGFIPKANIVFSAYSDEEYGGSHGALAASLKYPCKRILNMDCKSFEIWHCASGGQECFYRYHTAEPVDSAYLTGRAIPVIMDVLEGFAQRRKAELSANRFYANTIIPETSLRYMGIKAGNNGSDLGSGEIKFVYYTDKTKDEIYDEFRQIEQELKEKLAPLGIIGDGFVPATRFFHYAYAQPDCASIQDLCKAARSATGRELPVCGSCLSDLSVIVKYGSPEAFGFGIGRDFSEYGGAHQPDEFVNCDELVEYTKIIAAYILQTLG